MRAVKLEGCFRRRLPELSKLWRASARHPVADFIFLTNTRSPNVRGTWRREGERSSSLLRWPLRPPVWAAALPIKGSEGISTEESFAEKAKNRGGDKPPNRRNKRRHPLPGSAP